MHEKSPLLVPELFAQCSFSIVAEVCYITIEGKVILVSEEFSVSFISSDEKRLTAVVLFVKYALYVQLQLPPQGDKTAERSPSSASSGIVFHVGYYVVRTAE